MPPHCSNGHSHHCRAEPYTLWLVVYPVEGGEKVAGGTTKAHCWEDSEREAKSLIRTLAISLGLDGDFVATWRHCYGQETSYLTPFSATPVPPAAPRVEVEFD